ncbi:MAG: NPCBM/NEW2 domain-containing protein [Tannerella sp.]|jgi:nicotinamidase-related amidase|nr:NPCBM/NEW2 domain-containing protein [Tannerella sp.]
MKATRYFFVRGAVLSLIAAAAFAQRPGKAPALACLVWEESAGRLSSPPVELNPSTTAVIVIDVWNYHWCMTASERVAALVPRMNAALEAARRQGMQVVWNPSDATTAYGGYPQYERTVATARRPAPDRREDLPVKFTAHVGPCMCGPGLPCKVNYGWDGMHPGLTIGDGDLFSSSDDEMYAALTERGITDLIYMGVHTNECVFGKPGALSKMWKAGFRCFLARDLNDAFTRYDPAAGYTPEDGTAEIDENLRQGGVPCINLYETFRRAGLTEADAAPVDYVRFTPWGKRERPYFFEDKTIVTLTAPWLDGAEIRYTTDGSRPTPQSPLYVEPLEIAQTQTLCAAAFRDGACVSLPGEACYVKLPEATPPLPDVYLDDLDYIPNDYLKIVSSCMWYPAKSTSFEGKPLRVREETYGRGLGFRAPSSVQYEIRPAYKRFVAQAGVDDNLLSQHNGRFLAMHSSVVFKIFIDGRPVAESPVMRISQAPWRFDIEIPPGSRRLHLACTDAGSRHLLDYGNWINAGFITR